MYPDTQIWPLHRRLLKDNGGSSVEHCSETFDGQYAVLAGSGIPGDAGNM